jgi:hypothetical protein
MRVIALVVVAALVSGCAARRAAQVAFVTASALDLHSTHIALASGKGEEANPLMRDGRYLVIKIPATVGLVIGADRFATAHPEHERLVCGLLVAFAGLYTWTAIQNYRIAGR